MTTIQLNKISDKELEEMIPMSDYVELKNAEHEEVFAIPSMSDSGPFPLNLRENETVDLEVAIRRCKRVGVFNNSK